MTVPKLGAQSGTFLLWVILISCFAKVPMQYVFARHVMHTGKGTMEILSEAPFKRLILGYWVVMQLFTLIQLSGTLQGLGQLLSGAWPAVPPIAFAFLMVVLTIALLLRGSYAAVDIGSIIMVIAFTVFTVGCAVMVQSMPEWSLSLKDIADGLQFKLPPLNPDRSIATALAVFGMTGMAATDVIAYPYWLKAAGWADAVGPAGSADRQLRMNGWLKLLRLNVVTGCVIYTIPTIALYLLGGTVLLRQHLDPNDSQMVKTLAEMYVPVLGRWTWIFFLIGGFSVLYSTLLGASGGHSLVQADFARVAFPSVGASGSKKLTRLFYIAVPMFTFVVMLFGTTPVTLVLLGGAMQALMLPLMAGVALWLHYSTKAEFGSPDNASARWLKAIFTGLLWAAAAAMTVIVIWGLVVKFR